MAQQPNIELDRADLPNQPLGPAPARRWKADRPGYPAGPGQVPWGGAFGTPGPDTGYVHKLVAAADPAVGSGEDRPAVVATLAHLAAARASYYGRGPTPDDVAVALLHLGLDGEGLPGAVVARLGEARRRWVSQVSARPAAARRLVAAVPLEMLAASPDELRTMLAAGSLPLAG